MAGTDATGHSYARPLLFSLLGSICESFSIKKDGAMTDAPTAPTHDWNGDSGDRWAANIDRLDRMLIDFGAAAIKAAAARPGERILDIGSGSGTSSFELARLTGVDGHILGIDISQRLVDLAQAATPVGAPVTFACANAATAPLPAGSFDLLFSRFGVMFFDDPTAAFAHLRQALKPNGRTAFVCWRGAQENDWLRLPVAAIRDIVDIAPADPDAPGPFAFGDAARLERILADAGFADVVITPFDTVISYGHGETGEQAIDDALDLAFQVGPLARILADKPDAVRDQAADAVRAAFARRAQGTSVLIDGAAWIVTARNPGS